MVFACDGMFATASQDLSKTWDPEAKPQGSAVTTDLAATENSIASAFNRGIATNLSLSPQNWAAAPSLSQRATISPDAKSTLAPSTYFHAVTAINANGETTPSLVTSAQITPTQQAMTLARWKVGLESTSVRNSRRPILLRGFLLEFRLQAESSAHAA